MIPQNGIGSVIYFNILEYYRNPPALNWLQAHDMEIVNIGIVVEKAAALERIAQTF